MTLAWSIYISQLCMFGRQRLHQILLCFNGKMYYSIFPFQWHHLSKRTRRINIIPKECKENSYLYTGKNIIEKMKTQFVQEQIPISTFLKLKCNTGQAYNVVFTRGGTFNYIHPWKGNASNPCGLPCISSSLPNIYATY